MAGGTTALIYTFLGIDAGAGEQFDRMASKTTLLGGASSKTLTAVRALGLGFAAAGVTAAVASVKLGADFQTAMERIRTQANASQKQVAALSKGVLAMAGSVATTPAVLADAAYHIASVGQKSLSTAQQLGVLRLAAEGAKIGGADLTDTTNALTAAVVSGIKGAQDYSQAMGILNATVGAGDMKMQDLANALSTGVTIAAKQAGVTLQQMGAALAVFGDNNVRGAKAGTQLRMSIQALEDPVKEGAAQFKTWHLSMGQLAIDMQQGGLPKAIADLRSHMMAVGDTGDKIGASLVDAFGKRAGTGIATLVGEFTRFQNKIKEVNTGGNKFPAAWAAYTKTLAYQFDALRASVEAFLIKLNLLPEATKAFQWINGTAVPALERLETYLQKNKAVAIGLAAGFGALLLAIDAPVSGLVILGAAAFAAYKKFGAFRDGVHEVVGDTLTWAKGVLASFEAWWAKNGAAIEEAAERIWTGIRRLVKVNVEAMVAIAKVAFPYLKAIISDTFRIIGDIVVTISDLIDGKWSKAASNMNKTAEDVVKLMIVPFTHFGPIVGNLLVTAGEDIVKGLVRGIESQATDAVDALESVVGGAVDHVKSFLHIKSPSLTMAYIGRMMGEGLINGFTGEAAKIKDALSTPIQNALDHMQTRLNATLTSVEDRLKTSQSRLASLLSARKSAISSLRGSIIGSTDISNVLGQTDALGNPVVGNIGQSLASSVGLVRTEATDLARLRKMGLSQTLLDQISAASPQDAITLAQQILSGQAGSISSLNSSESLIQRYAKASATTVVESPAEKQQIRIASDQVSIQRELVREQKEANRKLEKIAGHLVAGHTSIVLNGKSFDVTNVHDMRQLVAGLKKLGFTASVKV